MGESSPRKAKSGAGGGKGKVKAPPKNILSDAQKKVHVSRPLAHATALTPAQDVLEAFAILDADRAGLIPGCTPPHPLPPPSLLPLLPICALPYKYASLHILCGSRCSSSGKDVVVALRALGNEPSPAEIK